MDRSITAELRGGIFYFVGEFYAQKEPISGISAQRSRIITVVFALLAILAGSEFIEMILSGVASPSAIG